MFLATGALRRIDASTLEVEPALRGLKLVRWLLWPAARPALALGATVVFVLALNQFAIPTILQVKVFPAEMWIRYSTNLDATGAWAVSWPLIVAPLLLLLGVQRSPVAWPQATTGTTASALRRQLGGRTGAMLGGLTGLGLGLAVVLPLAQLAFTGRTWLELPSVVRAVPEAIGQSFGLAAATATFCLALAAVTWRWRAGAVLWLPFLMPGALLGIAMIGLFNRPMFAALYGTTALVLVAFVIRYAALARHAVAQAARGLDREITDAARLDGAHGWSLLRHVHGPLLAAPAAAAWYVTYLVCLWDVETLVLIQPPGGETLALRAFNLLHYGHGSQVNAICVVLLGLAVLPLAGWWMGRSLISPSQRERNAE
jgi:ABC-type Fe3+ transport system permease subunit